MTGNVLAQIAQMVLGHPALYAAAAASNAFNPAIVISLISAAVALVGGFMSYRASTRANATSDRKVDLEEFRDQQTRYTSMIETQEKFNDRLRAQIDRLSAQVDSLQQQLARETDVSNALRDQVRALQGQMALLQRMTDIGPARAL